MPKKCLDTISLIVALVNLKLLVKHLTRCGVLALAKDQTATHLLTLSPASVGGGEKVKTGEIPYQLASWAKQTHLGESLI